MNECLKGRVMVRSHCMPITRYCSTGGTVKTFWLLQQISGNLPTTGSLTGQGPQWLCSEIHDCVYVRAMLPMDCSQLVTECDKVYF